MQPRSRRVEEDASRTQADPSLVCVRRRSMTPYAAREWSFCTLTPPATAGVTCLCALGTLAKAAGVCVPVCNVRDVPIGGAIVADPACTGEYSSTCRVSCRDGYAAINSAPQLPINTTCVDGAWREEVACVRAPVCDVCACGLTTLDCRKKNLTEIPGIYPQQVVLDMRANALTELSVVSFSTSHARLVRLDVASNPIARIQSGSFDGLTALVTLNLEDLAITTLPDALFAALTSLEDLSLGISEPHWPTRRGSQLLLPDTLLSPLAALTALSVSGVRLPKLGFLSALTALQSFDDLTLDGIATDTPLLPLPPMPFLTDLCVNMPLARGSGHMTVGFCQAQPCRSA